MSLMKSSHCGNETYRFVILANSKKFILEICNLMKYFHYILIKQFLSIEILIPRHKQPKNHSLEKSVQNNNIFLKQERICIKKCQ